MFSALPFAGATETQNIEKNSLNQNLIQNTVGTNAVTDKSLKVASSENNIIGLQNWFQKQDYYTQAINGSYSPYTEKAEKSFPEDAGIMVDTWTKTQTDNAMQQLTNNNNPLTDSATASKNPSDSAVNKQNDSTTSNPNDSTVKSSTSTNSQSTASTIKPKPISKTNAQTITKTKLTVTKTTISGWFMPTGAYDSGYAYQWHYMTWLNYDPSSGQWGVLKYNPKGADGGELTSSVTDVDFDGVSGYEKEYNPRWQLKKA